LHSAHLLEPLSELKVVLETSLHQTLHWDDLVHTFLTERVLRGHQVKAGNVIHGVTMHTHTHTHTHTHIHIHTRTHTHTCGDALALVDK
jgi:hypothetical protein